MMINRSSIIIIQRVIPHYRVPLFHRLHKDLGVRVVTARNPPLGSFLNLADPAGLDFAIPAPFEFPDPNNEFQAKVPTSWILQNVKPDVVVAEFGLRMSSTYELIAARHLGAIKRLAFWSHGWQMGREFETLKAKSIQYSRLPLFACADALASYSDQGALWLRNYFPKKPIVSLGNALDISRVGPAQKVHQPELRRGPRLLAVGRFTTDKDFARTIDIFRDLLKIYPDAQLTIIGDGPENASLVKRAGNLYQNKIKMPGMIYDESKLSPYFEQSDLMLLAGAAGLAVNHALAYSLPIVAFARGTGAPNHHPEIEYVTDGVTGILVDPPKNHAMVAAIAEGHSSGAFAAIRNRMSTSADIPTVELVVKNFSKLIDLMLNEGRERSLDVSYKMAFVWNQFTDYHDDRCREVAEQFPKSSVTGIEFCSKSRAYPWHALESASGYRKITLFDNIHFEDTKLAGRFYRLLGHLVRQDVVFLAGYERAEIFLVAIVLRLMGRRVYIMNDSKFSDKQRQSLFEVLKGLALKPFSGAMVAGPNQLEYLRFLGFKRPIALGYDTISLRRMASYEISSEICAWEKKPFVFIGRFIEKKNIDRLILAYSYYEKERGNGARGLILVGDGPLRERLEAMTDQYGLRSKIQFTGFLESHQVATILMNGFCLIIPSIEEQWGLVVNEGLAFGLPIISSTVVGAAQILVRTGTNGFLVEPDNITGFAFVMKLLDGDPALHEKFSQGSRNLAPSGDVANFSKGISELLNLPDR